MNLSAYAVNAMSAERIRARMHRSGMTMRGDKLWTSDEDSVLLNHYPDVDRMAELISGRSRKAIGARCRQLGMRKPYHKWLASEISALRKLYPAASHETIKAALPGLKWPIIADAAKRYKIRRKRKKHSRCGKAIMDDILIRIEEIGWTLSDLDAESGTKNYFRHSNWRRPRRPLNHKAIAAAVKALGGDLNVTWKDFE